MPGEGNRDRASAPGTRKRGTPIGIGSRDAAAIAIRSAQVGRAGAARRRDTTVRIPRGGPGKSGGESLEPIPRTLGPARWLCSKAEAMGRDAVEKARMMPRNLVLFEVVSGPFEISNLQLEIVSQ